jgi:hypothetical protein
MSWRPIEVIAMTKLDEISRVIGDVEAELRGLAALVAEVRQHSAEHHQETRERLESISGRVVKIESDMKPLTKTVATMEPYCHPMENRRRVRSWHDNHHRPWMDGLAVRGQVRGLGPLVIPLSL